MAPLKIVVAIALFVAQLSAPPATGRLSGHIINSDDGTPIADAQVEVQSRSGTRWEARTDANGVYDLRDLPAGQYTVWAEAPGFARSAFGLRRSRGVQSAVPIAANSHAGNVDVALTVEATVSGRVTSTTGAPVSGVIVTALRPHLTDGQRLLREYGRTTTNADGRYRIGGLLYGDYYVTAGLPSTVPTFCPGRADPSEAVRVRVLKGSHVELVDLPLVTVRWTQVSGVVRSEKDAPLLNAAIIMQARDPDRLSPGSGSQPRWVDAGQFLFDDVPPGEYIIRTMAAVQANAPVLFAARAVSVSGANITDLSLTVVEGATLSGRVRLERHGTPPPDLTQMRLFVPLIDGTRFGGEPDGQVRSNGVFRVTGVDAGRRLIRVSGVPAPWMLSRVTQKGRDITDAPFDVLPGARLQDVELTLTDLGPSFSGTVRYASGLAAVDMLVVAFSTDRQSWRPLSRHVASTRTNLEGHYRLGPLPAGPYRIVALQDYEEVDLYERDTLDQITPLAIEVPLSVGQTRAQDLRALPDPARRGK